MNSKGIEAIKEEKVPCTCVKCLKEYEKDKLHLIHIPSLGYGSGFDMTDIVFALCDDCYKESTKKMPDLWSMQTTINIVHYKKNDDISVEEREKNKTDVLFTDESKVAIDMQNDVIRSQDYDEGYVVYKYENEMFDYLNSLPLKGAEVVYNRLHMHHTDSRVHNPQDWIDYQLDELPHDLCKKNGWVSPDEIETYQKYYGRCGHVKNLVWGDGSKGSQCFIHPIVNGKYGGICKDIGTGCYNCEYFIERRGNVDDIELKDYSSSSKKLESLREKEVLESGIQPKAKRERLSIFKYKKGEDFIDAVVIKIDNNKVLIVDREDFRDVLHDRKKAEDVTIKWIDEDNYCVFISNLVEEREEIIKEIETKGKLV